jgi:hypothetical protein
MDKYQTNIFTIACDMDDVLMVPHTYIEFSKYLGIYEQISLPLTEYKSGKRSYKYLWESWHNILAGIKTKDKEEAIIQVAGTISENTYRFVERSKKLGRFIIVSNNDGDLVKAIAGKFDVEYVAVNKYIFKYSLVTQRKSEAIKKQKISIDAAVTDDPVNEKDFLDLPAGNNGKTLCGIVFRRNDMPSDFYHAHNERYKIAGTLDDVYENLVLIKKDIGK